MARRRSGVSKLTPEVRERLASLAAEARQLIYGEAACPEWGTSFAAIEEDCGEVGHEIIRLMMEQSADEQAEAMPAEALTTDWGEVAQPAGAEKRRIETESGSVEWQEPKGYLPKSRKAFFPSGQSAGDGGR
ncbi:hypothetical protein [Methylocaldum sp.]|uniref:hypothetical protein n=1 Tax=Methylocaldum sp. TaxID=1969727 RepID=UPI00321FA678